MLKLRLLCQTSGLIFGNVRVRVNLVSVIGLLPCLLGCLPFKIVNGTPLRPRFSSPPPVVVVACRGSHGPDGRVAREIGSLPLPVFELFSLLGARWMQSAQVPGQFLESRIISLVKPGKIVDHTIGVDNLRPITVLSCWYRIWAIVPGLRIL